MLTSESVSMLLIPYLLCFATGCATVRPQALGLTAEDLWISRHSHRQSLTKTVQPSEQAIVQYHRELDQNVSAYLQEHAVDQLIHAHLNDHRVVSGMTREQVILLCGTPDATHHMNGQEVWIYKLFASATYQLYFNENTLTYIKWSDLEPL